MLGAHTPWFTVLTWRGGNLVRENAPGRWKQWAVDAYANGYLGWRRTMHDGRPRMTSSYVTRTSTSDHHWTGRAITYEWRASRWQRVSARDLSIRGDRKASQVGGWHVKGLNRWPW